MATNALLDNGDELLLPSPDYPLWTAAASLSGGTPVHYLCDEANGWMPDLDDIRAKVTPRTKGIVVINPNNPTGALYSEELLRGILAIAREHGLVVFADEVYDKVLYDGAKHTALGSLSEDVLTLTFNSLSKSYRSCGYRAGWLVVSGDKKSAKDYIDGLNMLSNMRLCSNVPGQWAVQTALGGHQSIYELTADSGRLGRQRRALLRGVERSPFLDVVTPRGALYAFPGVDAAKVPGFDDARFAMELLEREHVLVVPGSSFNVPYKNHVRMTLLPDEDTMAEVFTRIDRLLGKWAAGDVRSSS